MSFLEVCKIETSARLPREFVICDYCFWAASAISFRSHQVETCPQCSKALSRIPLGENESYSFNCGKSIGVELSFETRS